MINLTVELVNPCPGATEVQFVPLINLVDRLFLQEGCGRTIKNHQNGSILIKGAVSSAGAQRIKDAFCKNDGSIKAEFRQEIIAINW